VLLFSVGDVVKQRRFIEEKSESEQRIAHEQLRTMVGYAETRHCRRTTLLRYFGEDFSQSSCNGCDNCLEPRETFDGTIPAQKFLSCVHRVQAKQGFGFGLNHIVEVLIGGTNDAIKKRGHDQLSTFGIGADLKREQWQRIGRELLRLGLLEAAPGKFATLSVTNAGMMALRKRTQITLTKPIEAPAKKVRIQRVGEIECDEELFERLRALRRKIADERDVPAYIIFSDATLRQMAQACPQSKSEFAQIAGVGQQKLKEFAEPFLAEIGEHLRSDLAMAASSRTF
jgi:ATP-dependent DNA helicase RecQ